MFIEYQQKMFLLFYGNHWNANFSSCDSNVFKTEYMGGRAWMINAINIENSFDYYYYSKRHTCTFQVCDSK